MKYHDFKSANRGTVSSTPEYKSYTAAKQRCTNPRSPKYYLYGARGIEFRFISFEQFFNHIGPRPSKDHSLDRINTFGHYEHGNIRWATKSQQQRNIRTNPKSGYRGVHKQKRGKTWDVQFEVNGKTKRFPGFVTPEDAAFFFNTAIKEYVPDFPDSLLNKVAKENS